jgi:glycerophosphoryl diester phosphodiesterase
MKKSRAINLMQFCKPRYDRTMNIFSASQLVAHRGDHEHHPENSLAAFRQALEMGARWLECDVQFTRDAVPVVFHDDNLRRMFDKESAVAELLYGELPALPDGQPIPTLKELLALLAEFPRASLFMEVKTAILQHHSPEETVAVLEAVIEDNPQVIPISFSAELLVCWWRSRPRALGWLGDESERAPKIPLSFVLMSSGAFLRHGCAPIAERVGVYTVNDADEARQLLLRSADLIETDYFSHLKALLNGA